MWMQAGQQAQPHTYYTPTSNQASRLILNDSLRETWILDHFIEHFSLERVLFFLFVLVSFTWFSRSSLFDDVIRFTVKTIPPSLLSLSRLQRFLLSHMQLARSFSQISPSPILSHCCFRPEFLHFF